jgi:hypothetical protein
LLEGKNVNLRVAEARALIHYDIDFGGEYIARVSSANYCVHLTA